MRSRLIDMASANVVIITNVGQGYGRAAAFAFGQTSHDVVCTDPDADLASKTAAEIESQGGRAIPIQANMSVQFDVTKVFTKVREIFGDLTGVVHIATQQSNTPFCNLTETEFRTIQQENVISSFLTLKAASDLGRPLWFVIVGPPTSSSEPHMVSVRGAMQELSAAINGQIASVRVNLIFPSRISSDPRYDARLSKTALFLGSSQASGISGQIFNITLPKRPEFSTELSPEVRAALDESVRQDDLEATIGNDNNVDDTERNGNNYSKTYGRTWSAHKINPTETMHESDSEAGSLDKDFDRILQFNDDDKTTF